MAILKKYYKLKGSSLTEVIVATVIVVLILGIAMATINNTLFSSVKDKGHFIENELNQLIYEYKNRAIKLPYHNEVKDWLIQTIEVKEKNGSSIIFKASNKKSNKSIIKKVVKNEIE